jgi:hypothetical protein
VYSDARLSCLNSSNALIIFLASYSVAALGFNMNCVPMIGVACYFSISRIRASIYSNLLLVDCLSYVWSLKMNIFSLNMPLEKPMFSAVSSLSPVSIQTFIPALLKSSITSGTPSCSLSSKAVAPSKKRLFSISF